MRECLQQGAEPGEVGRLQLVLQGVDQPAAGVSGPVPLSRLGVTCAGHGQSRDMTRQAATHVCGGCEKGRLPRSTPGGGIPKAPSAGKALFLLGRQDEERGEGGQGQTQAELLRLAGAHRLVSFTSSCTAKRCLLPDLLHTGSGLENLETTRNEAFLYSSAHKRL